MKRVARALVTLVLIAGVARGEHVRSDESPAIKSFRLGNGLGVVLAEDSAATSVVIQVRYLSGAALERPGQAGYTHVLEKLLSAGSVHVKDFDARLDAIGGWTANTTTGDYLAVTDQVPAHALELALWLEAERMAGLADGITADGVARARSAVLGEWRAAYVDEPYALVAREVERALWSDGLAGYANPILGDGKAVQRADVEAMRRFAGERLAPNNALLVIAGRFDAARLRRLVERYFAWLPSRQVETAGAMPEVKPRTQRFELTVPDPIAKVVVAFRCPPFLPAIDIAAQLLAGGRDARLQRRLVDGGLASDVHAEIVRQRAAELRIEATVAAGVDPARVATAIRDEIASLRARITPEELAGAVATTETDFLLAVENLAFRVDWLATRTDHGAGPLAGADWLAALREPDAAAVQKQLAYWLADAAAVTVIGRGKEAR